MNGVLVGDPHHGQAPAVGLGEKGRGYCLVRKPHPEADAHGAGPLHLADKTPLLRGRFQPQAGGEDEFAAVDEALRVLQLGHRHPVDVLVPGGLGNPHFGQVQGLDTQEGGKGNGHEPRINGR
jgi:hypothetical protein